MPPITNPQQAAGFASDIGGLVEDAKKHAHQAIEDLGPAVDGADANADDAVISIARCLNALVCIEENLAEVIEQAKAEQSPAAQHGTSPVPQGWYANENARGLISEAHKHIHDAIDQFADTVPDIDAESCGPVLAPLLEALNCQSLVIRNSLDHEQSQTGGANDG